MFDGLPLDFSCNTNFWYSLLIKKFFSFLKKSAINSLGDINYIS
jgi:hypothetical protein